jgi:predicted dinucleotide-binding enzyme/limonene-1,2-epoxide hydrolase
MKYAIIGSGAIGTAIARQFARQQLPVLVANTRGPASLQALADELGPSIIPAQLSDALGADMVFLAVPFDAVDAVLKGAPAWNQRIIIDTTNAIDFSDFSPADLGGRPSTHLIAEAAPGARLVKSFNTMFAKVLARKPDDASGRRVLYLSGDDQAANTAVAGLIERFGYAPIDLGPIAQGGLLQQFGGALTTHSMILQRQGGASLPEMDIISAGEQPAAAATPVQIAETFFAHWSNNRIDAALGMLAKDVLYDNVPFPDIVGRDEVAKFHRGFGIGTEFLLDWTVTSISAAGNVVLNERVDIFKHAGGGVISLPVMGTLTVENGEITVWRDYFDAADFDRQLAAIKAPQPQTSA